MGRTPIHITAEDNILRKIEKIKISLEKMHYKVSASDIWNEATSYGLPFVRIRIEKGNKVLEEILKEAIQKAGDTKWLMKTKKTESQ
jgi:hypothetical protein